MPLVAVTRCKGYIYGRKLMCTPGLCCFSVMLHNVWHLGGMAPCPLPAKSALVVGSPNIGIPVRDIRELNYCLSDTGACKRARNIIDESIEKAVSVCEKAK